MARSPKKTGLAVGAVLAQLVAGPLTLRDISRRRDRQIRGPRLLWQIWAGTNLLGVAAYWTVGRKD
ncbi:hypothetical protein [Georgenia alba]|uniref:Cardiolipin synthase N-terminal domain-containing protein n=1 Tax=Georgenia alba TaxID=2233858 RepID=A0ABW2Q3P8_9MICO